MLVRALTGSARTVFLPYIPYPFALSLSKPVLSQAEGGERWISLPQFRDHLVGKQHEGFVAERRADHIIEMNLFT